MVPSRFADRAELSGIDTRHIQTISNIYSILYAEQKLNMERFLQMKTGPWYIIFPPASARENMTSSALPRENMTSSALHRENMTSLSTPRDNMTFSALHSENIAYSASPRENCDLFGSDLRFTSSGPFSPRFHLLKI